MPSLSSPKPAPTVLRFCASCGVTLACWALWLVLGASLAVLAYIAVAKELPVPDFVLRRAEANLAKANLGIKFGRAQLDPTGKILFENVQFYSHQFAEPLLTCRLLYLSRDFWSVLAGRPVPDEIQLEGASLLLPALLSPSGTTEPLIRDLSLVLSHDDQRWLVEQFTGRVGQLVVTAQGEFTLPGRTSGGAAPSPDEIIARFLKTSRQLALAVHRLDAFDQPALAIRLESPPAVGNTAHLLLTAGAAHQPWGQPLNIGPLAIAGTLRLDGKEPRPLRLHAAARRANYRETYGADLVRAIFTAEVRPENLSASPRELLLAAGSLNVPGGSALGPVIRAGFERWPEVQAAVQAGIDGEFLAAEVDAHLRAETARVRAEGRVAPELISRVLTQITPRAAPYFVFGDPVEFQAEAVLGPGWRFARLASRVNAGRIDSRGVKITAARGRIDIDGMDFLAHDARLELDDNFARGSYGMNFTTSDYRMLLDGRLRPPAINGWFRGDWWLDFWNAHFDFTAVPPAAEVEVSGRWRDATRTFYFGSTDARNAGVWGGNFEQTHAVIFLRPGFTHALTLDATRAGGAQRLAGTFKRFSDGRFDFDFAGNLEPAMLGRMLDGKADDILASLRFSRPPQLHAQGTLDAVSRYSFTGQADGGLHYYGFPLQAVQVAGAVDGERVRLDDIQFTAVGGKGSGQADVTGPANARRLGFNVAVTGADLARTLRATEEYQAGLTGEKITVTKESKFMKRAEGGRLDVALSAKGVPGELNSFTGNGNASLTGMELGEIHLFGLLSQVLSGFSLNFSSLKLDTARSSFRLQDGRLLFPDLKISGGSAVIDARGNFTFASKALDFTARLKPYEENRNLFTAAIGIVINPLTSILELKLTGPVSNPDWSIVVGGSSSHPEAPAPVKTPSASPLPVEPAKNSPPKS